MENIKTLDQIAQLTSPEAIHREKNLYSTTTNFHSEKHDQSNSVRKAHKKDTIGGGRYDSNRDMSPYQVENFIEMLHNFGISDSTIKKKIMTTSTGYNSLRHEGSLESNHDSSTKIKNVRIF